MVKAKMKRDAIFKADWAARLSLSPYRFERESVSPKMRPFESTCVVRAILVGK